MLLERLRRVPRSFWPYIAVAAVAVASVGLLLVVPSPVGVASGEPPTPVPTWPRTPPPPSIVEDMPHPPRPPDSAHSFVRPSGALKEAIDDATRRCPTGRVGWRPGGTEAYCVDSEGRRSDPNDHPYLPTPSLPRHEEVDDSFRGGFVLSDGSTFKLPDDVVGEMVAHSVFCARPGACGKPPLYRLTRGEHTVVIDREGAVVSQEYNRAAFNFLPSVGGDTDD